jgi:hypothetical protein
VFCGRSSSHYFERKEKSLNDAEFSGKFSYWKNSGSEPLRNLTIGNLIKESALVYKDKIAVSSVHQNAKLTYKQLHDQARERELGTHFFTLILVSIDLSIIF